MMNDDEKMRREVERGSERKGHFGMEGREKRGVAVRQEPGSTSAYDQNKEKEASAC